MLEDGSRIEGEHLVMGEDYIPQEFLKNKPDLKDCSIARCIIVSETALVGDGSSKCMVVIPPFTNGIGNPRTIYVLQLDNDSNVAPKGYYVVHLSTEVAYDQYAKESKDGAADAEIALKKAVSSLYEDDNSVLWSTYFLRTSKRLGNDFTQVPGGIFFVTADYPQENKPSQYQSLATVCFQSAFYRAKAIFEKICPEGI